MLALLGSLMGSLMVEAIVGGGGGGGVYQTWGVY